MSFTSRSRKILSIAVAGFAILFVVASGLWAETNSLPVLTLRLQNVSVQAGTEDATINVYLANYSDTLSGFSIRIVLEEPDFMEFRTDIETMHIDTTWEVCDEWSSGTCTHWYDTMIIDTLIESGAVDTTGCMISGWEYVTATSSASNQQNIKVTGLADRFGGDYNVGLTPQGSEGVLFRLRIRTFEDIPESPDSIIKIQLVDGLSETNFSNPNGDLIGTITQYSLCDTSFGICEEWSGEECIDWKWVDTLVEFPDSVEIDTFWRAYVCDEWDGETCIGWADSMCAEYSGETCISWVDVDEASADTFFYDSLAWTYRDTSVVFYSNAEITVLPPPACECGDMNGDGSMNIADCSYVINDIFFGGPPPAFEACKDPSGDGDYNIVDASYMINAIFFNGPPPQCP